MYLRLWEDFYGDEEQSATTLESLGEISATPTPVPGTPGTLDGTEDADIIEVNLVAGQTYTFDYRGTADGVVDPYLGLFGPGFAYITEDDDGGAGRGAMITYTPTVSGTYYLYATSFYTVDTGDPSIDTGGYTINMWSPEPDVPGSSNILASLATAVEITVGTTFGNMEAVGDNDYFAIDVTAGMVYSFGYAGGVWGAADRNGEPGENLGRITLYDAAGNQLSTNFNYESGTSYFAATDTTIYVRAQSLEGTGGYTLDVTEIDPSTRDPLEAFIWDNAVNITPDAIVEGVPTVYIYFGDAGENFGTGEVTYGWQQHQIDAVMHALNTAYTPVTGFNYVITEEAGEATFKMITVQNQTYGARFYPQDPAYGSLQGVGSFNLLSGGFGSDPASLLPGGFSYGVILHEFGHAHGIAHPHDTGGGSEIMLGVTAATGSMGVYDLNQGVYTVMSYNDGWNTHPDGDRNYSAANRAAGWSESLGAFDIAVMQERGYVTQPTNVGDTVYTIADTQADSSYITILDSSGTDTINYVGNRDAQIDLLAATLDYTPTGGGVVSFAHGVWGGYTIANGVVIENASGGSGDDVLLGNNAANTLTGNDGDDFLLGRAGNDILRGGDGVDTVTGGDGLDVATLGSGNDVFVAEVDATKIATKVGTMSVDIITDFDAAGNDLIDLSNIDQLFTFRGTNANKNDGDLTYKTYSSINGAENALGIDIDGQPGASGVSGPVTVVFGNVDGGAPDFAIVLLGTSSVDADDFMFGAPPAPATFAASSTYGDFGDPTHDNGPRTFSSLHGDYALV
jgi:Ca2+-binding RTX toxin-like protein